MSIAALIFDFDGTLAELTIDFMAMRDEVQAAAHARGFAAPWPGQGYLLEQVQIVAQALGNGFADQAQEIIMAREMASAAQGRLFPFTTSLLARARQRGLGLAVISRNCGPAIRLVFPGIDQACDVFLPREAAPHLKPHPGHVTAALEGLGVAPAQAAMVGDHPTDLAAGLAAGCLAVGVASGRVTRDDLAQAGAAFVLDNASTLLDNIDI
jgi:phosphoglycolate phosphatase